MAIDSGSRLWDSLSDRKPEELQLSAENRALLRRVFFVKPVSEVRRVIFIATPHHGSFVAEAPIGEFLARLVTPAAAVLNALNDLTTDNAARLSASAASMRLGSAWSMSPDNPLLEAFSTLRVAPSVAANSIIAVEGSGPVATGDDGVVSYQSAHIPEAESELVVRSGHSVQSDPHTVAEIRRILFLHLARSCPNGCKSPSHRILSSPRSDQVPEHANIADLRLFPSRLRAGSQ